MMLLTFKNQGAIYITLICRIMLNFFNSKESSINHQYLVFNLNLLKVVYFTGNMKVHHRLHSDEKPFKCDIAECERTFRTNESLRRHKLIHMGEYVINCEISQLGKANFRVLLY